MARSIGPRIQVDGEAEYRKQINDIIQQAKTLDAEMGALTASFDENTSAQEKAIKSSKLLGDQLKNAEERTKLVRDMVQKSAEATGENSKQTLQWREALANAEKRENELRRAVEQNNAAINDQGEAMVKATDKTVGLGDGLDKVAAKLGISIPEGAQNALNSMGSFSTGSVVALAGVAAAAAGVVKGVKELWDLTLEAGVWADDLLTQSSRTGIDAERLQGISYAQRFIDFEGDIGQAVKKVSVQMGQAAEQQQKYNTAVEKAASQGKTYTGELGAQAAAFEKLGIEIQNTDGSYRSSYDVFSDIITALGEIEDGTERNIIANSLLGKSYDEWLPLVNGGMEELDARMQEAAEAGITLSQDQVEALGRVNDAQQALDARVEALKLRLGAEVAPLVERVLTDAANGIDGVRDAWRRSGLSDSLDETKDRLADLADGGSNLFDVRFPEWLRPVDLLKLGIGGVNKSLEIIDDYYENSPIVIGLPGKIRELQNLLDILDAIKNLNPSQILGWQFDAGFLPPSLDPNAAAGWAMSQSWGTALPSPESPEITGAVEAAETVAAAASGAAAATEEAGQTAAANAEVIAAASETVKTEMQALADEYSKAFDAARASLDGQVGLWATMDTEAKTSIADLQAAVDTQATYLEAYADNLAALLERNIPGIEEFAAKFTDGSTESAAALAGLADASDEEIGRLIASMQEVDKSKDDLATTFAGLQTDLQGKFEGIAGDYAAMTDQLHKESGEVDFSPFMEQFEQTFGTIGQDFETKGQEAGEGLAAGIEESSPLAYSAASSAMDSAVSAIYDQEYALVAAARYVAAQAAAAYRAGTSSIRATASVGHNASGTDNWRGGLTWVGERGPELALLPAGTRIWSHDQSMSMSAGSAPTVEQITIESVTIDAKNVREFNDIVRLAKAAVIERRMQ